MSGLLKYLCELTTAKLVLWCYLIWYLCMAGFHFDASPYIWLTSLGISAVIGLGLILSVSGNTAGRRDVWTTARLFLMPFCVSSFSALIKNQGFILILSPRWQEDLFAIACCTTFVVVVRLAKRLAVQAPAPLP